MTSSASSFPVSRKPAFVPETRFGLWFLSTATWRVHVLGRALNDLQRMAPDVAKGGVVLDIGTGQGHSLPELAQRFHPSHIHALDPEPDFAARCAAMRDACPVLQTRRPNGKHGNRASGSDTAKSGGSVPSQGLRGYVGIYFLHALHHIGGASREC